MNLIPKIFKSQYPDNNEALDSQETKDNGQIDKILSEKRFLDINSDSVLSDWEVKHALREIIANALDETELRSLKERPQIYFEDDYLVIRDFGSGIEEKHFVQNESLEKRSAPNVIGKYGAGLKDAIAVLHKNEIEIKISSSYIQITGVKLLPKQGSSVKSLHLIIEPPDRGMVGTKITLKGVSETDLEASKKMFLHFKNYDSLAKTNYGNILASEEEHQTIYYKGLAIAEVTGFLFSYNITREDSHLRKNLNRERMNVGRTAWTNSVKNILKNCEDEVVIKTLEERATNKVSEDIPEELKWKEILVFIYDHIASKEPIVFLPASKALSSTDEDLRKIEDSGKVLVVDDHVIESLSENSTTLNEALNFYENDYTYNSIALENLENWEREYFNTILNRVRIFLKKHNYYSNFSVSLSEEIHQNGKASGVWVKRYNSIYLKRSTLKNERQFVHTIFHEIAHAQFDHGDETRAFERDLGNFIADIFLEQNKQ